MKQTYIFYWIFTGLLAALMLFSAVGGLMPTPEGNAFFHEHLGYPLYLAPLISVAKLLGVAAILIPKFPRLREWAYAGFCIDMVGAGYSFISIGDPFKSLIAVFVGLFLLAGSYFFYHKKLRGIRK